MNKWHDNNFLKTLSPKALETLATKMTGISKNKGKLKQGKIARGRAKEAFLNSSKGYQG